MGLFPDRPMWRERTYPLAEARRQHGLETWLGYRPHGICLLAALLPGPPGKGLTM